MKGFIIIDRNIVDSGMLKYPMLLTVWLYFLAIVSHKKHYQRKTVPKNSGLTTIKVLLKPGQLTTSYNDMVDACGISPQNARTILKQLEKQGSILIEPTYNFTKITIVNYWYYQRIKYSPTNKSQSIDSELTPYNNGNNDNNAAAEDEPFQQFSTELKKLFTERNIPIKKMYISIWVRKLFKKYGREALEEVYERVIKSIEGGKFVPDPIAYGATILKEDYPEIGSRASQVQEGTPSNEP